MESQNIKEYELIRKEMLSLKNCMTAYIGFVLGGSGAAFFGLVAVFKGEDYYLSYTYASMTLSVVVSLILLVLFYKFNSYNRYAGYCKLLNQEQYELKKEEYLREHLLCWEICVDRLRDSDFNNKFLYKIAKSMKDCGIEQDELKTKIVEFTGPKKLADRLSFFHGLRIVLFLLLGRVKSRSWQFPLFVVFIFLILTIIFSVIGSYFFHSVVTSPQYDLVAKAILIRIAICIAILQAVLWVKYIAKLYNLMEGSATVASFCWRFLPIRYDLIKDYTDSYEIIKPSGADR
ncbi:hypothetical protein ACFL0G_00845 [Candidatus Zixiibacteriota bacterium]